MLVVDTMKVFVEAEVVQKHLLVHIVVSNVRFPCPLRPASSGSPFLPPREVFGSVPVHVLLGASVLFSLRRLASSAMLSPYQSPTEFERRLVEVEGHELEDVVL